MICVAFRCWYGSTNSRHGITSDRHPMHSSKRSVSRISLTLVSFQRKRIQTARLNAGRSNPNVRYDAVLVGAETSLRIREPWVVLHRVGEYVEFIGTDAERVAKMSPVFRLALNWNPL